MFPRKPILKKNFAQESQTSIAPRQDHEFTRFLDITTLSRIGESNYSTSSSEGRIKQLESEIKSIKLPEEPLAAERLFENKKFNEIKTKMPHLPYKDIQDLIMQKWKYSITEAERSQYFEMAALNRKTYFETIEEAKMCENELRAQIHQLQFGGQNKAVKPTGKLRYLTAYRFYRREEIPKIKMDHPQLEGRQRHALVKQRWKAMSESAKFPYVLMSRADEERAKYALKIAQIRNNLL